jgi:hypothetical protein
MIGTEEANSPTEFFSQAAAELHVKLYTSRSKGDELAAALWQVLDQ